jgi:DNA-binding beta-propeller fold protein YncE
MRAIIVAVFFASRVAAADVLVVANRGGNTATIIDPVTMTVIGNAPAGPQPHEVAISTDGRFAYVTNYVNATGSTLTVIDLATRTIVKTIDTGLVGPHGILMREGQLYFTAESSSAIGRYDPETDRVDWIGRTAPGRSHMLAMPSDASTVYGANIQDGSLSIIDVEEDGESIARRIIPTVAFAEGIALSPDGLEVWTGSVQGFGMAVVDLASETVVARFAEGLNAYRIVFNWDGRFALVPRGNTVVVYDAALRTIDRTISFAGRGQPLSIIIPTGSKFAWISTANPHRVEKLDLETFTFVASVPAGPLPDGMAYHQDRGGRRRAVRR